MAEAGTADEHDGDEAVERILAHAPILDIGRVAVGSNAVFQAVLQGPRGDLLAIYKPARGERPLWDFPDRTLHRREVATFVVDRALGWGFSPVTVLRPEAPFGVGSMQAYVPEPPPGLEIDRERLEHQLRGLAALDVVINNADRKRAHILIDADGAIKGIDHGVTFNTEFKLRSALVELGGSPVPPDWLQGVKALLEDPKRLRQLRERLRPLLTRSEVTAFEHRSRQLLESGLFPSVHPFYGRPFEW
jgi:hypothetical protein